MPSNTSEKERAFEETRKALHTTIRRQLEPLMCSAGGVPYNKAHLDAKDAENAEQRIMIASLSKEVERLRKALEKAREDFYEVANQAGGYVDTRTPEPEAKFLQTLEDYAVGCATAVEIALGQ